jgi:hypothetical protein
MAGVLSERVPLIRNSALLLCTLIMGCQSHTPVPSTGDINSNCPKVLEQSRAAGVDYVPTLRRAARGDDAALSQLFQLTGSDHLDSDAQQCHIEALAELLNRLGDLQFASALSNESADTRRAVVNGLVIELADPRGADVSRQAFADRYPHTAATLGP